jgi:hypothetical protein
MADVGASDLQCCARCGRVLGKGEVTYRARITIMAEWKGRLADAGDEDLASYVGQMGRRLEGVPPELLEEEIHREVEGRLCLRCKERFAANPFSAPLRPLEQEERP